MINRLEILYSDGVHSQRKILTGIEGDTDKLGIHLSSARVSFGSSGRARAEIPVASPIGNTSQPVNLGGFLA
jgi:hypothetical protein